MCCFDKDCRSTLASNRASYYVMSRVVEEDIFGSGILCVLALLYTCACVLIV